MTKQLAAALALFLASTSFAAVDVNTATAADLDGIKGIGPVVSRRILHERSKRGEFRNWEDFISRVKGIGTGNAERYSSEGLTVGGESFRRATVRK